MIDQVNKNTSALEAARILNLEREEERRLSKIDFPERHPRLQSCAEVRDEYFDDEIEGGWPEPFRDKWYDISRKDRPEIAVAYLDHIIETGKVLE